MVIYLIKFLLCPASRLNVLIIILLNQRVKVISSQIELTDTGLPSNNARLQGIAFYQLIEH